MGTKNNPGKFDCYAKAEPDEPMFVLLGRDKHAPTLVWLWSVLRELDQEDAEVVLEAQHCCVEMIRYATSHGRQVNGLGAAVLAGILDLIRVANRSIKDASNVATGVEALRILLAETTFPKAGD